MAIDTKKNSGSKRQVRRKILAEKVEIGDMVSYTGGPIYEKVEGVRLITVDGRDFVEIEFSITTIAMPRDFTVYKMEK